MYDFDHIPITTENLSGKMAAPAQAIWYAKQLLTSAAPNFVEDSSEIEFIEYNE